MSTPDPLQPLLERMFGPGAAFRDGQREAIQAVVRGERTLVISPLLSLMRSQIDAASALGLRAQTINSGNRDEWERAETALCAGDVDVLLVSPERLGDEEFATRILRPCSSRSSRRSREPGGTNGVRDLPTGSRCTMDDDLLDDVEDLLDPTTPEGITFIAGSGLLDDEDDADGERCTCWCGCRRRTRRPDGTCARCQDDRHRDDG